VTLRPGDFLGLPAGFPSLPGGAVALRYLLCALAVAWAMLLLRGRAAWAVLCGAAAVGLVMGFWAAALGRPYGVLIDEDLTRRAAQVAVASGASSFVPGVPLRPTAATALVRAGVPADLTIALPTLAPVLVAPVLGLVLFLLWPARSQAALAASLWLAFSTSEAEAVRGAAFLPGLWSHPRAAILLVTTVVLVLSMERVRLPRPLRLALMVVYVATGALLAGRHPAPPWADRLMLATLDEFPWLPLALVGARMGAPDAARVLAAAGGGLFVLDAAGSAWAAHAAYRLGLLLLSVEPLDRISIALVGWLRERWPRLASFEPGHLGPAVLILLFVPGSFLARWRPPSLDEVAYRSLDPIPTSFSEGMQWVRSRTPAGAVFVASPDYAATLAVLGQRPVLRAPPLVTPDDDGARQRLEQRIVAAPIPRERVDRYGVRYLLFASGDEGWLGVRSSAELDAHPGLRLVYHDRFMRVYELAPLS
jgi:hypothetical protein